MWFYIVAVVLVVLGIVGGIFGGGIFTIVLLPIAAIIVVSSVVLRGAGEAAQQNEPSETREPALPHNRPRSPEVPTTPERLVDERRIRQ
jgi:uncharacterized protein (DUF58 family)